MLVRYGFDYKSALGQTVLIEALAENGTALFQQLDTLAPSGVYVSKSYNISLDALSGITFRVTPQLGNEIFLDNFILNQFIGGANLFTNGDFASSLAGWTAVSGFGVDSPQFLSSIPNIVSSVSASSNSLTNSGCASLRYRPDNSGSLGISANGNSSISQLINFTNGNTYYLEFDHSLYTGSILGNPLVTVFRLSTISNLLSPIAHSSNRNDFIVPPSTVGQMTPVWNKKKYSFVFNGTTGTYYCGFLALNSSTNSNVGAEMIAPELQVLIDNTVIQTGSFSSSNLFKNPQFAANGNDWDYNTGVWAWNAGEMRFEII